MAEQRCRQQIIFFSISTISFLDSRLFCYINKHIYNNEEKFFALYDFQLKKSPVVLDRALFFLILFPVLKNTLAGIIISSGER